MAVVNRCALAVAPRPPMREWSRAFWPDPAAAAVAAEPSLYLIPPLDDTAAAQELLQGIYGPIFAAELDLWCGDRNRWPTPLSFELFEQWFSLQLFPLVTDLGDEPLQSWAVGEVFREQVREALP